MINLSQQPYIAAKEIREQLQSVQKQIIVLNSIRSKGSKLSIFPPYQHERKVITIGCFDLFHRGHENMLRSLRDFGGFVVVGIHDDASYFQLKNKHTVQKLEERMANVKRFADMVFVIPSTDPTPYLQAAISEQDIANGTVCYVRGEDMPTFPGREYIENRGIPICLVPRTEDVSSSLLRKIYHNEDPQQARLAAFAATDSTGKPILM